MPALPHPNSSLETLMDHVVSVSAGLASMPETAPLATPFDAMLPRLRAARDARDDDRWTLRRAQRRSGVVDTAWDRVITDCSGRAFLAAGKDASADPYDALFGTVRANDAIRLGRAKTAAFGARLLERGRALAHPDLTQILDDVARINARLVTETATVEQAFLKSLTHEVVRRQLYSELGTMVSMAEVGVLTAFPGRRDLVTAMLAAERSEPTADGADATDVESEPKPA